MKAVQKVQVESLYIVAGRHETFEDSFVSDSLLLSAGSALRIVFRIQGIVSRPVQEHCRIGDRYGLTYP
jgi:hypothetical protein